MNYHHSLEWSRASVIYCSLEIILSGRPSSNHGKGWHTHMLIVATIKVVVLRCTLLYFVILRCTSLYFVVRQFGSLNQFQFLGNYDPKAQKVFVVGQKPVWLRILDCQIVCNLVFVKVYDRNDTSQPSFLVVSFGNNQERSHFFSDIQETRNDKSRFHYLCLRECHNLLTNFFQITTIPFRLYLQY